MIACVGGCTVTTESPVTANREGWKVVAFTPHPDCFVCPDCYVKVVGK